MNDDIKEKVLHVFDLLDKKVINAKIARSVTKEIFETGNTAEDIIMNRPLKPCSIQADFAFVEYSDELIAKVFKEYPEVFDAFKRNDVDARSRIAKAALRICNDGYLKCSMSDLIQAADRYLNSKGSITDLQ